MIDDALLDRMRQTGDPAADAVIESFLAAGEIPGLNALMGKLHANMGNPAGYPPILSAYLEESSRLPPWADPARIERAQRLFTLHGPVFGLVMLFKSLPILYAAGMGGAQVLAMTGQLTNNYRRRAAETLRFILDVMEPGGLGPGGKGIRTTQKVRLMHAAIRAYAAAAPGWRGRLPEWGRPINQEELGGTLLAFSSVTLEGVKAMGLTISREDKEAYLHVWKVIGHVLGIDPALYPKNMTAAKAFWKSLDRRNFRRTDAGLLLIRDHQAFLAELIPIALFDRAIPTLLRYLMGRRIAGPILDLPKSSAPIALLLFLMEIFHLEKLGYLLFPGLIRWARKASIDLMESFQRYMKAGHAASRPFQVPPSLTEHGP